ncbi:MAG: hypothetical protein Q8P92_05635 [Candidatus Daviesbacteria bacterium]|nr:hypothetical protein [Candidatus Daviesbacteria bacterium]
MIKGRFALFCDYALTSSDGKLSILGEFDHFHSSNDSPILQKGFLVASFEGEANTNVTIGVKLAHEKGDNVVFERDFNITIGRGGRANILIEFGGLPFKQFGIYKATFSEGKKEITSANLGVSKVEQKSPARS